MNTGSTGPVHDRQLHLGVDPTAWGNWERGELILFREHRTNVAKLLGLDPQALADEMRARWNGKHRRWEYGDETGRPHHLAQQIAARPLLKHLG